MFYRKGWVFIGMFIPKWLHTIIHEWLGPDGVDRVGLWTHTIGLKDPVPMAVYGLTRLDLTKEANMCYFKKWANPGLFSFIIGLFKQTLNFFTTNICEKMSIQYMVPGIEPMTFGTWVSSHNH